MYRRYGCSYGQPLTIQLEDCDDPLAGYNDKLANDPSETFQVAMYKLSVILGRIRRSGSSKSLTR